MLSKICLLLTAAALLLLFLPAAPAVAMPENPCTKGFKPDQNYTELACNVDNLKDFLLDKVYVAAAPAAIGILTFFLTIFVCIGRHCCGCCGSSDVTPSTPDQNNGCMTSSSAASYWRDLPDEDKFNAYLQYGSSVRNTKLCVVLGFLIGGAGCVLAFSGVNKAAGLPDVIVNGLADFVGWVINICNETLAGLNPSNPAFTNATAQITDIKQKMGNFTSVGDDLTGLVKPYSGLFIYLCLPNALVAVAGIVGILCMLLHIRSVVPALMILCCFVAALPVGILGTVASVAHIGVSVWCEEAAAQQARAPGMMQNFLVPTWCEDKVEFGSLRGKINSEVNVLMNKTCSDVSATCSPGAAYSGGALLVCAGGGPSSCTVTQDLVNFLGNVTVKTGAPNQGTCTGCTLQQCTTTCTGTLRTTAKGMIDNSNDADKAYDTLIAVLDKYLSCNIIADRLLTSFNLCTGASSLKGGLEHLMIGSYCSLAGSVVLIIFLFRGQKRFFKDPGMSSKEQAEAFAYSNSNAGTW